MMTNLFSIFDPTSSTLNFSLNWVSTILGILFSPQTFWLIMPRINFIFMKFFISIYQELMVPMGNNAFKGTTLIFVSLFFFIMINNSLGLFPYIFTSTSHLTMTLPLALPLWLSINLYGWINNMNHMFSHLLPQNTPTILMPFMVLIEKISNFIRAVTLSVRLTANMIAGHLLLTLLSSTGISMSTSLTFLLIFIQILLLLPESAVSIILEYVFMVLGTLYPSEVN